MKDQRRIERIRHHYKDGYRKLGQADAARLVSFDVLYQVEAEEAFANLALQKALRLAHQEARLDARDAAFASELVHGTLRSQGTLDWALERHMERPVSSLDPAVRVLLRMGAHQLLGMRVPDHAAVAATMDVARIVVTDGPSRMVNAVLRALAAEGAHQVSEALEQLPTDDASVAVKTSHPEWMVREFRHALSAHGYPTDELQELLESDNRVPLVTLVARPGLISVHELAEEAEEALNTEVARGRVSPQAVIVAGGDPARLLPVRDGRAGVQDEGSQLGALVAVNAPTIGTDQGKWLDLCAGPGGKAALVGAVARLKGAHLVANELHPHRARLVTRAVAPLGTTVDVVSGDGRYFGGAKTQWPLGSFDRVVVDAPCSGMGSLRRRSESRWRRHPEDMASLIELQQDLLDRALQLVRLGGVVTFITCSPHRQETRTQVERLLKNHSVELLDTASIAQQSASEDLHLPLQAGLVQGGGRGRTVQLWNHRNGTDFMFIASLRRTS